MKHPWVLLASLVFNSLTEAQTASPSIPLERQPPAISSESICGGSQSYEQLTADERKQTSHRVMPFGKSPIELTIMATEFSGKAADLNAASSAGFCFENTLTVGVNISSTGEGYSFLDGEGAFRGGGGDKLAPEDFTRLQSLMDSLPDDQHHVPPAPRRILVKVLRGDRATVRLYDSANLPDAIVEMLRLTRARIKVVKPLLMPKRVVPIEEAERLNLPISRGDGERALSPDGRVSVHHDFTTKLLTVMEERAWPEPPKTICTIPESWQPERGGYAVNSEFSPDGRFLLVTWGLRVGALLFDTATWQAITDATLFPQHLKEYLHSPDWHWGMAVTEAGEVLVWDQQTHRIVSRLPGLGEFEQVIHETDAEGHAIPREPSAEIRGAAFSPDGFRVALFHGPDNIFKLHLSIFDVRSGQKERDLWPVEWMSYSSGQPVWWNDGRWVIAQWSSQYSGGGMGVWDAPTGRFIGNLDVSGCDARIGPVADSTRLLQACFKGDEQPDKVLEWDVESLRKELQSDTP